MDRNGPCTACKSLYFFKVRARTEILYMYVLKELYTVRYSTGRV